jgi:hypothetical protein
MKNVRSRALQRVNVSRGLGLFYLWLTIKAQQLTMGDIDGLAEIKNDDLLGEFWKDTVAELGPLPSTDAPITPR